VWSAKSLTEGEGLREGRCSGECRFGSRGGRQEGGRVGGLDRSCTLAYVCSLDVLILVITATTVICRV